MVMVTEVATAEREIVLVEDAHIRPVMGIDILEPLPSRDIHYARVDPFLLVHEGRFRPSELVGKDTRHPHRGFDNIWYVLQGAASTGHSTGPGGSIERAHLDEGSLLWLRTGRGVWHAEAIGADEVAAGAGDTEFRGVLFWVNLARRDKQAAPSAQVLHREQIPERQEGDAIVRVLVGDGSTIELGTPGLILDVTLPRGGDFSHPVPADFNGFVYLLEGDASFGANRIRARREQIGLLGPGETLTVADAQVGTRFLLMAGKPYGETPNCNGPFVD